MTILNSNYQLRQTFIEYFKALGHEWVPGSSLIPANDPTLLFTNAGMVQFKEVFLGLEQRAYTRAASVQRCLRAGGKHNDLESVGYTARHHTFFEMLGNFSFGDYFKREAIQYAWQFLTETLALPKERLWVSVFHEDKESEAIWLHEMHIDPQRLAHCGEKDNFWQMGDTGPCGPCTEIFYDHGPGIPGGPPGSAEQHGDRYVELWNLVFMQYERDIRGQLLPLPKPCVDTGMGLERLMAVMQGVHDNYDIDLFQHLLRALASLVKCDNLQETSMRVIVDHIRSVAFLIMDGVTPSNEGRGYVLRRIIRRAIRHGYKLGQYKPFFHALTPFLIQEMGEAYPELKKTQSLIEHVIEQEEIQFSKTLSKGMKVLDHEITKLTQTEIPGPVVFQLYDTYGFPPDLIMDIACERHLTLDWAGFNAAMEQQREQSQQFQPFAIDHTEKVHIGGATEFVGYHQWVTKAQVTTLLHNKQLIPLLKTGEKGVVVLDQTPFYAESGGQVGDSGYLYFDSGSFRVKDTQKQGSVYLHWGEMVSGQLRVKDVVRAEVDHARQDIMLNHSATHLLHEALRRVLGEHVMQKGSLVEAKRLRFDFSHPKVLTNSERIAIERLVNQQIRANVESTVVVMTPEEAKAKGALALFGERYGKEVRVLRMGQFSTEICGGTHVQQSGEIGLFKITLESACASGVRRIEAVTGESALFYVEKQQEKLQTLSDLLKTHQDNVITKLQQLIEESRTLDKELTRLKQLLASQQLTLLVEQAIEVNGIKVLAVRLHALDRDTLRHTVDQLKQQLKTAAIVLATVKNEEVQLVAGVTKSCLAYFNATQLLNQVAHQVGGKGGGRPDLAEGGGRAPAKLLQALESVPGWIKEKMDGK